jgi:mxaK protein
MMPARRFTRWVWIAVAVLVAAAAFDGWRLLQRQALNAQITSGQVPAASEVPELRFAHAHALAASAAAAGQADEAALNQFRALQGNTPLGRAARYNSANLLLRQALQVREGQQPGQAIALLELAKESLREVLREDPEFWDARYNLERAQRLLPDPPEAEEEAATAPRERERAATTMRAQTLGLP